MPSLTDLANQVKNLLSQIQTNTSDTSDTAALIKGDTADIKSRLDTLNTTLTNGFATLDATLTGGFATVKTTVQQSAVFLGQGIYAVLEAQREANAHLATNVAQNNAIICWLTTSARLLCQQLRELEQHTALGEQALASVRTLEGIADLVHAREYVEYSRKLELEARLAECCPDQQPEPRPCFEPCPEPKITRHDPDGQDWKPPTSKGPATGDTHYPTEKP